MILQNYTTNKQKTAKTSYGQATCELIILGSIANKLMLTGDLHMFDEFRAALECQYTDMPPTKPIKQISEADFYECQTRLRVRFDKFADALEESRGDSYESKNGQFGLLVLSRTIQATFDNFKCDVLEPKNPISIHTLTLTHDEYEWETEVSSCSMPNSLQVSLKIHDGDDKMMSKSLSDLLLPLINLVVLGYLFDLNPTLPENAKHSDEVEGVKGNGEASVRNVLATLSHLYDQIVNTNESEDEAGKLNKLSEVLGSDLAREYFNPSDDSDSFKVLDDALSRIQAAAKHVQEKFADPCYKVALMPELVPIVFIAEIVGLLSDTVFSDSSRDIDGDLNYINVWVVDGDMWKFLNRARYRGAHTECSINNMDLERYLEVNSNDSGIMYTHKLLSLITPAQITLYRLRSASEMLEHNKRVVSHAKSVANILGGDYKYCLPPTGYLLQGIKEGEIDDTNIHQIIKEHFNCSDQQRLDIAAVLSAPTLSSTMQ